MFRCDQEAKKETKLLAHIKELLDGTFLFKYAEFGLDGVKTEMKVG